MNTKQIDCVLELANTLNFNRAAENLFITQPALSYQIKSLEAEVGFQIFLRSGKGAALTLAGERFCEDLRIMRADLRRTIETCRNFSQDYNDVIRICLPYRTTLLALPDAIKTFNQIYPDIFVDVTIDAGPQSYADFLQYKYDVFFAIQSFLTPHTEVKEHKLYDSHIYLVVNQNDELANLDVADYEHLKGRTLLVGGGSPKELQKAQRTAVNLLNIPTLTSETHETTLINIASNRAVCLIPGLLNDYSHEFVWIPFESAGTIPCVLCTRKDNTKESLPTFIEILQSYYKENAPYAVV
ncbi:MAG: LysR family transcriptional regulator [Veillonella sp.]|uniref:LysR family transcriptional regulator n=1 Tax=Veillonella sp. TaxID=1926307 RepID=UPI0025D27902|nr:LysR family transcriptional regulator [Veillonella sp.]MBS4914315.1 LysR family transcriptional regulator [Veillonella sp.]